LCHRGQLRRQPVHTKAPSLPIGREGTTRISGRRLGRRSDQADGISYALLVKELSEYACNSTSEQFSAHCNALLSDLAGVGDDDEEAVAEGISSNSNPEPSTMIDGNSGPKSSAFSAPSAHRYSDKEQAFRERVVKEFPDLCSDTLPPDGPSATLPDGTPYKVRLHLKPGAIPQGRPASAARYPPWWSFPKTGACQGSQGTPEFPLKLSVATRRSTKPQRSSRAPVVTVNTYTLGTR